MDWPKLAGGWALVSAFIFLVCAILSKMCHFAYAYTAAGISSLSVHLSVYLSGTLQRFWLAEAGDSYVAWKTLVQFQHH